MIRFFQERSGSQKAVLWVFILILVVGLAVVFTGPSSDKFLGEYAPLPTTNTVVAEVGKYDITVADIEVQMQAMNKSRTQMPGRNQANDEMDSITLYPTYGKNALDSLVNARTVRVEADRLNLGATREEMRNRILSTFSPNGRWIGTEAYERYLRDQGLTVAQFESDIADAITEEKLRNFLTAGLTVSDAEVEDDYKRSNTTLAPTFVLVTPKPVGADVVVSDADLKSYFDSHKDQFKFTQRQAKLSYVFIDQTRVGETMQITDDELRQSFDPETAVSAVRVSQIVFNVASQQEDATIRTRAQGIADQARGGNDKPAADFAELAKTNSADKATGANGGDAGFIEKSAVKPGDPRGILFTMKDGQVSQPIKVGNQYVIYKIAERRKASFEEAREQLVADARQRKSYGRAVELADQAEQKLKSSKDAAAVAAEINTASGAAADKPVASVRETGFVQPGDQIPGVGSNPQIDEFVRSSKKGDVGSKASVQGGLAVPMIADTREPQDAAFEDVKDRVAAAYREQKSRDDARVVAEQLATATSVADLQAKAKAAGYEASTQATYTAGGALPGLPPSDLIDQALLGLPSNSVAKSPLEVATGYVVLAQGERKEAEMGDTFAQQKDSIRQRLLATRQGQLYATFMTNRVQQMKDAGDIVIYQPTIDRAFLLTQQDGAESGVPTLPPVGTQPPGSGTGRGVSKPQLPPQIPSKGIPPGAPGGPPAGAPSKAPAPPAGKAAAPPAGKAPGQ